MPVRTGENVRVNVPVGNEEVVFIFKPYEEMSSAIKKLCSSRIRGRGMKQRVDVHGPRELFVRDNLLDVENVEYRMDSGEYAPLTNQVEGWIDKIPINWRFSAAAFFEESEALSEDEMGES